MSGHPSSAARANRCIRSPVPHEHIISINRNILGSNVPLVHICRDAYIDSDQSGQCRTQRLHSVQSVASNPTYIADRCLIQISANAPTLLQHVPMPWQKVDRGTPTESHVNSRICRIAAGLAVLSLAVGCAKNQEQAGDCRQPDGIWKIVK